MVELTSRGRWVTAMFSFICSNEQMDGHTVN